MNKKYDIGIIGLAVMGQNFVLNIESHGHSVAVYNRTASRTDGFIEERARDKQIKPTYNLEELVNSLSRPRKVMLMVKAGKPVDIVIDNLIPHLEEDDIIIDGGNSHFKDTERRYQKLKKRGIRYLGTGISGGEYGALHGPSIMPGGDESAYEEVEDIFTDVAAQTEDGPCVTYLGPESAGHYVKMVHNGIEYGVMALLSEVYDIMRKILNLEPEAMSKYFREWDKYHKSYLVEITYEILERKDEETGNPLINIILDRAKQKGTGKWSVQDALDLGIPIPTINAAVNARSLSAIKEERIKIGKEFGGLDKSEIDKIMNKANFIDNLEDALYSGIVIAYAEGMKLLQEASIEYDFELDLADIARIWEDGCIIRSALLKPIQKAYKEEKDLTNLIISSQFKEEIREKVEGLRKIVNQVKKAGVPIPAMNSALDYFDILRAKEMPASLIQGQRDYFGAHTYERRDKEGTFHTEWQDIHNM
ncbi:MAG: NADP-dependent phosphogluconate dehydrogenase [Halanaerobiales bacterium]